MFCFVGANETVELFATRNPPKLSKRFRCKVIEEGAVPSSSPTLKNLQVVILRGEMAPTRASLVGQIRAALRLFESSPNQWRSAPRNHDESRSDLPSCATTSSEDVFEDA